MYVQDQLPHQRVNDDSLRYFKAIGVDYLTVYPPPRFDTYKETVAYLKDLKALAQRHGLVLNNLAMGGPDAVTLARPERDAELERWCDLLRAMGAVGVPTLGYNFKPIGNFRTTSAHGRGGARYSTFDYEEYAAVAALSPTPPPATDRLEERL